MSGGFYDELARVWQDSKIDGLGMLNPQELAEEGMKNDSRLVESVSKKWNLPWLEAEAHGNVQNPAKGIGKASTAVASAYAGGALGGLLGGAGGGATSAVPPMAEMGGPMAAQIAQQMGLQSGQAAGLMGTMESAMMDTGYTPSSLMNAARYGPESGQTFGQTMGNYGQGLMNKAASPGFKQGAQRYALRQGMDMMSPQQTQYAPPRQFQQPQEPMRNPYSQQQFDPSQLTEEQKMQLRMMGYPV